VHLHHWSEGPRMLHSAPVVMVSWALPPSCRGRRRTCPCLRPCPLRNWAAAGHGSGNACHRVRARTRHPLSTGSTQSRRISSLVLPWQHPRACPAWWIELARCRCGCCYCRSASLTRGLMCQHQGCPWWRMWQDLPDRRRRSHCGISAPCWAFGDGAHTGRLPRQIADPKNESLGRGRQMGS
jgi:hypothetical protein